MTQTIEITAGITITATDDIRIMIDEVMTTNEPIVQKLLRGQPENAEILRELMINMYIRGFFCGAHHKETDLLVTHNQKTE